MREMPTQVGSTGNNGGAEGLPEVQESVLEHAAPEARQNQGLAGRLAVGLYPERTYKIKTQGMEHPNETAGIWLNLPSGIRAPFRRVGDWEPIT
jgi:hypothetical protein